MLDLDEARKKFNKILSTQDAEAIKKWKIRNEQRKLEKSLRKEDIGKNLSVAVIENPHKIFSDSFIANYDSEGETNYAFSAPFQIKRYIYKRNQVSSN